MSDALDTRPAPEPPLDSPGLAVAGRAALLLLFPGFFLYHSLRAALGLPPVLGGFFGVAAVGLAPLLVCLQLRASLRRPVVNHVDAAVALTITFHGAWSLARYLHHGDLGAGAKLTQTGTTLFVWLVVYLAARGCRLEGARAPVAFTLAFWAMVLIALAEGATGFLAEARRDEGRQLASWQGLGRSLLVTALLLWPTLGSWARAASFGATVAALFLLGARTEFAGFVIVVAVGTVAGARLDRVGRSIWVAAAALTLVVVVLSADLDARSHRVMQLLDLESSRSFRERQLFHRIAWDTIQEHPFAGGFASPVLEDELGTYAHNALSAWVDYGLIGFCLFVYVNLAAFAVSAADLRRRRLESATCSAAFLLCLYSLVVAVAAKSVFDPIFAVGWGLAAGLLVERRRQAARAASPTRGPP
ncbi:MAG: O-antigen ligase family protein [Planctomycetes bacterium]|nr:O-antigen ligase family protein [Planctomycetota bacterium]